MRALRRSLLGLAVVAFVLAASACTDGEEPVPIDFSDSDSPVGGEDAEDGTPEATTEDDTTTATTEDPNAEVRQQVIDAAEQQCLDDPTLTEGVVRLVDPETDEVVNEYVADCAEVRGQ